VTSKHLIPIVIELVGISIVSIGIGLEIASGGDVYLVVITAGSLIIATGGMIFAKILPSQRRRR